MNTFLTGTIACRRLAIAVLSQKLLLALLTLHLAAFSSHAADANSPLPSLKEAVASKEDLYGNAAMRQPNGPSYEFFEKLLPSLHYVNADFQHYPIVLSAPNSKKKSRLIANGSGINLRANTRSWNELGTPVMFRVGNDEAQYGELLQRLTGPKFAEGYLPIVELDYVHNGANYVQETFASVDPAYSSNAVSLTQFTFKPGTAERTDKGRMVIRLDTREPATAEQGRLLNAKGQVLVWFDSHWKWLKDRNVLETNFKDKQAAAIAVTTIPMPASTPSPLDANGYAHQRQQSVDTWQKILQQGMNVEVPEPYVNDAWRSMILANFSLINGDRMHYSAGNQYDQLYEQEGSEAALAMMFWGYEEDMKRLVVPLLDFTRKGLEFHQAGHKLDDVCRYYWQTRDAEFVKSLRPRWQKELDRLTKGRAVTNGLYPREQYCGDIATPVFSMNSNAKGWRAMRDTAALLDELGDKEVAAQLRKESAEFHQAIMAAVDKSVKKDVKPIFIPNALFGEEEPYDVITGSRMGSYWNLMVNTFIGSEVFGQNSELETGMVEYLQQHGGLFMGLTRSRPWPSFWISTGNLNPLYGLRYVRTLLRRDEPERALVSFYGMLAAGLSRDTFTCGEGCSIEPLDQWGRQYYCPPNSAGNAFWLQTFRRMLVQDWDLDEDGAPDTLRLMFATPKRWLEDGKVIKVERAPTTFGSVSMRLQSKLSQGEVIAEVDLPQRQIPKTTLLRIRVPDGWTITGAESGSQQLQPDNQGTVDISTLKGKVAIRFKVKKS
ncbi:MAG: hypothetical protein JWQ71_1628 [Pedosphaera sp.]|nr:hypothetical protein [Pedosphaera sp.]